jgi:hypothetical protein
MLRKTKYFKRYSPPFLNRGIYFDLGFESRLEAAFLFLLEILMACPET